MSKDRLPTTTIGPPARLVTIRLPVNKRLMKCQGRAGDKPQWLAYSESQYRHMRVMVTGNGSPFYLRLRADVAFQRVTPPSLTL